MILKNKIGSIILIILLVLAISILFIIGPVLQDPSYHIFSDQNYCLNITNFWNVFSNLTFLIVGVIGLLSIKKNQQNKLAYFLFFIGVGLVALGSGYYHYNPKNQTLIWDRLPMTIAFMALFSIVLSEFIHISLGKKSLIPLLFFGFLSILFWVYTNDLRLYILVQFYPILAIPIILLCYKSKNHSIFGYWLLILFYGLAKVCEYFDSEIHQTLQIISGHTLKHLMAALGIYLWIHSYQKKND